MWTITLLVLCLVSAITSFSESSLCCPKGQVVLFKKSVCYDLVENTTRALSLSCPKYVPVHHAFVNFTVLDSGHLKMRANGESSHFEPGTFCRSNTTSLANLNRTALFYFICSAEERMEYVSNTVLGYCKLVSAVFLIITAVIYLALPEVRDLQGKSIISFCISSACALGLMANMNLAQSKTMNECAAKAFADHYFWMASFFWTNAISIQILRSTRAHIGDHRLKEFVWYSIYAWGSALALTIIALVVSLHPGDHEKPGFYSACWFKNTAQKWLYMHMWITLLLVFNLGIFVYTFILFWKKQISSSGKNLKALRYKLNMSMRLIVVMGLPWIFEMIASLTDAHIVFSIFDVLNCLSGLLVFVVLVPLRTRIVKALLRRGYLPCCSGLVERYLAVTDDAEEDMVHNTIVYTTDDTHLNIK